ncbi:neck protein [Synechococcus phage DSL-LC03]|nr:neck protein [Synechococcus phage DSL-LC03]
MATNQFFTHGNFAEQRLVQDIINEQLRMYGIDVYYLPRIFLKTDTIIRENVLNKFTDHYIIEAYLNNYNGFAAGTEVLGKFGIQINDTLKLIISREKFEDFIAPIMEANAEDYYNLTIRPKEGDLIYFPLNDTIYEIKYVEFEVDFYQLNKLYTYELSCEPFMFEDELINTTIEAIDDNFAEVGYNTIIKLARSGSTAGAATTIANGVVSQIYMVNDGSGYTSTPTVAISSAPIGGKNATAVAIMTSYPGSPGIFAVERLVLTNPGGGYTTPPTISFIGGGGSGAIATAGISSGAIGIIGLTTFGSYYTTPPVITISSPPGAGTTATAEAKIGVGGTVIAVYVTNAGSGYTVAPSISFSTPGITTGNYYTTQTVIGATSGTNAIVKEWDYDTKELKIYRADGRFKIGEYLTGETKDLENGGITTTAQYRIQSIDYFGEDDNYRQNEQFEEAGIDILDFSESNPFGSY